MGRLFIRAFSGSRTTAGGDLFNKQVPEASRILQRRHPAQPEVEISTTTPISSLPRRMEQQGSSRFTLKITRVLAAGARSGQQAVLMPLMDRGTTYL